MKLGNIIDTFVNCELNVFDISKNIDEIFKSIHSNYRSVIIQNAILSKCNIGKREKMVLKKSLRGWNIKKETLDKFVKVSSILGVSINQAVRYSKINEIPEQHKEKLIPLNLSMRVAIQVAKLNDNDKLQYYIVEYLTKNRDVTGEKLNNIINKLLLHKKSLNDLLTDKNNNEVIEIIEKTVHIREITQKTRIIRISEKSWERNTKNFVNKIIKFNTILKDFTENYDNLNNYSKSHLKLHLLSMKQIIDGFLMNKDNMKNEIAKKIEIKR